MPADRSRSQPDSPGSGDPAAVDERVASPSWASGPPAEIAVHVATFDRSSFLPILVERLEAQGLAADRFEVVIVDNGSRDDTWAVLTGLVGRSPLRLCALRLATNRGPAGARNVSTAESSAPVLAFTDDDCLPAPGWLGALLAGATGVAMVQGRTEPDPGGVDNGAWSRSIRVSGPSPLFETCNIAYAREAFAAAGGFDEADAVSARAGGRAFGEDVLLGAAVVSAGGRVAHAPDALVYHRRLPGTYADHVREMRNLAGFPALAGRSAPLAAGLWHGVFLTSRTAAFDLGVVGTVAAVLLRRPVLALTALPWVAQTLPMAREHGGRHPAFRLAQLGIADAVGAASLLQGSLRHRRLVL